MIHPRIVCLQNADGWLPARRGALSASRHGDMDSFLKGGEPSAARKKYMVELVAERLSDFAVDHPTNYWMRRGVEEEPNAIAEFEVQYGVMVSPACLIQHPTMGMWLATPDGLISRRVNIEVKVPTPANFMAWVRAGIVPDEHVPQMVAQQTVADLDYTVFIGYCPDFPPGRNLFVRKFVASQEQRDVAETRAEQFLAEVEEAFEATSVAEFLEPLTFEEA